MVVFSFFTLGFQFCVQVDQLFLFMAKDKQPMVSGGSPDYIGRPIIPPSPLDGQSSPPPSPRPHPEFHKTSTFLGTWYEGKPWRPMVSLENNSDPDKIAVYLNSLEKVTSD